jgi:acyl carrier protein
MTDKLYDAVARSLIIPVERVTDDLKYNSIPEWDSVAHMSLIAELEDVYDIMLDTDDIVAMETVEKIRTILVKYIDA